MATQPPNEKCFVCGAWLEFEPVHDQQPDWEAPRLCPTEYRQLPHTCPPEAIEKWANGIKAMTDKSSEAVKLDPLEMLLDAAHFIRREKPLWAKAARDAVALARAEPPSPAPDMDSTTSVQPLPSAQRLSSEESEIEILAGRLAGAELNYRNAYEQYGDSHIETGRMWDKMRRAGNAIRNLAAETVASDEASKVNYPSPAPEPVAAAIEMVSIPRMALDWLHGEGPDLDGKWFGNSEDEVTPINGKWKPKYWWRSNFRKLCGLAQPSQHRLTPTSES